MIRGIPASANKKSQQWLYALVLSIAGIFRRALHLTPSDAKTGARIKRRIHSDDKMGAKSSDTKITVQILSIAGIFRRALYLPRSGDKTVHRVSSPSLLYIPSGVSAPL